MQIYCILYNTSILHIIIPVYMLGCQTASETGGSRYKLPGPGGLEGGPQPNCVAFVFLCIITVCQLYTLTLSYQAQVSLQPKVSPKI